ncbi:Aste57867_4416 [Aphanomyces stellatus]|uniref:Aste57867_4416 protein n=1 Tax=Aphanomyces stellatus TaxID=120398 RepID=A0A485KBQ3_9STRA|nr:hypothetical protein As57867_004404 [Aphanomyces stellatus]VFT81527.1 Aste57867_4416 [Aphanomyces stellatus]
MTQLLGYGVLPYVDQLHIDRSYPSTRREYPVEADRMLNLLAVLAKAAQNVELAEGETRKVFGHLHMYFLTANFDRINSEKTVVRVVETAFLRTMLLR